MLSVQSFVSFLCLPAPTIPSTYQSLSQINDFGVYFVAYLVNQGYNCSHQTGTIYWSLVGPLVGANNCWQRLPLSLNLSVRNSSSMTDRAPWVPPPFYLTVTGSVMSSPYTVVPSCYVFVIALAVSCPEDSISQPLSLSSDSSILSSAIVLEP